jgi:hypothetical protein
LLEWLNPTNLSEHIQQASSEYLDDYFSKGGWNDDSEFSAIQKSVMNSAKTATLNKLGVESYDDIKNSDRFGDFYDEFLRYLKEEGA